jgi:hypothetical protein
LQGGKGRRAGGNGQRHRIRLRHPDAD